MIEQELRARFRAARGFDFVELALAVVLLQTMGSMGLGQEAKKQAAPKKENPPPVNLADLPAPKVTVKFQQDFRSGEPTDPNLRFVRDGDI